MICNIAFYLILIDVEKKSKFYESISETIYSLSAVHARMANRSRTASIVQYLYLTHTMGVCKKEEVIPNRIIGQMPVSPLQYLLISCMSV